MACGARNELAPRPLPLSAEATTLWREFFDYVEGQCGPTGELRSIRDFAAKTAEHAARLAGVLAIVVDAHAPEIDAGTMASGVALAGWYVAEAARLQRSARTDPKLLRAQALLDWLRSRGAPEVEFRDVLQRGPAPTRTKDVAEGALGILKAHGWVAEPVGRPRRIRVLEAGVTA